MFVSKKKHRRIVETLVGDIEGLTRDLFRHAQNADDQRENAVFWRAEAERLIMTPEIKADTESAHKRGEAMARQKMLAWLRGEFTRVSDSLAEALETASE